MFGNELNRIFTEGGAHDAIIIGHGDYRLDPVTKDPTVDRIIQLTPVLSQTYLILAELPGVSLSVSLSVCLSLSLPVSLSPLSLPSISSLCLSISLLYLSISPLYLFFPLLHLSFSLLHLSFSAPLYLSISPLYISFFSISLSLYLFIYR